MSNSAVKEKLKLYEALLCSPGMSDSIKVGFQLSRKDILVLTWIIEAGLGVGGTSADHLISLIQEESRVHYQTLVEEILKKAGLSDFNEKLKQL